MGSSCEPYLLMAVLCQNAQQDQYGSLSIVNVFEQLVAGTSDPNAPEQMPTFRFAAHLAVSFASGDTKGKRTLSIVPTEPNGTTLDPVSQEIEFKGADHRATFISNLSIDITQEGVYWFDVVLDSTRVTRIPLRIRYERQAMQPWKRHLIQY